MEIISLRFFVNMVMVIAKSAITQTNAIEEAVALMEKEVVRIKAEKERVRRKFEKAQKQKQEKKGIMFFLKQRMEMQAKLDTMALTLKNKEAEHDIEMKHREADFQQRVKDKDADFQRKLKDQQAEFELKEAKLKEEIERTKRTLEETHKLAVDEVKSLTKLEAEQKIAKAQLDAEKKVNAIENSKNEAISSLKADHAEKIAKVKQEEAQQHYTRMTEALSKMNSEGSIHMKNFHQMTMSLLEHARPGQNINETRFLTGSVTGGENEKAPKAVVTDGKSAAAVVVE